MFDSDEDTLLTTAVDHLHDAAEALRLSDIHPVEKAGLLLILASVQRGIVAVNGEKRERRAAGRFVVGTPIH